MIWEAKGNKVFCGLCEQLRVVHEVIGGVPVFSCGVPRAQVNSQAVVRPRDQFEVGSNM